LRNESTDKLDNKLQQHIARVRRRRLAVFLAVALLAAGVYFGVRYYRDHHHYGGYALRWEKALESGGGGAQYMQFGAHILKYSKDGASCIDAKGKTLWMQSFEMKAPMAAGKGSYAAVADQGGNQIYIFNGEGRQGVASTPAAILQVSVSAQGVVAAIVQDKNADMVLMFGKDGAQLDISMKGLLDGDIGFPFDVALSDDGTQLLGSFFRLSGDKLISSAAFFNFSDVGKDVPNRFVGGFDDLGEGSMAVRVWFFSDIYSLVATDMGMAFFSTQNVKSPVLLANVPYAGEIAAIAPSERYLAVVSKSDDALLPYRLDVYKPDGTQAFGKETAFAFSGVSVSGDYIILYNENGCQVFNGKGTNVFEQDFDFTVDKVFAGGDGASLFVVCRDALREIAMKN
jgi:hypothetical protein